MYKIPVQVLWNRCGTVERALSSHQCVAQSGQATLAWLGVMWVKFVVGSHLEGFSLGSPVFLPPQRPTSPNSNLTRRGDLHENQLRLMPGGWGGDGVLPKRDTFFRFQVYKRVGISKVEVYKRAVKLII